MKSSKKGHFKQKVHDLLKDSSLQAIFIYGDLIDETLYQKFEEVCQQKEIFVSNVIFNNETGSVVAVNDYNHFAEKVLQEGAETVVRPDSNKFNLFGNFQKSSFKKLISEKKESSMKGEEKEAEHLVLNAAKHVYIGKETEGLVLKHPLFPTIFNKFLKDEHLVKYAKYYFQPK